MSKLKNKDFRYSVNYDYDTQYSCYESGCDSICRCGTIYNTTVTDVYIESIVSDIYSVYFDNSLSTKRDNKINEVLFGVTKEIDIYTIDRIIRHFKVYEPDRWEVGVEGGYYGDEIGDITLLNSVAQYIEDSLDIAFSINDLSGRIEYLVGLEYGHLLPELEGCSYEIINVDKSDIIFGSDGHYQKVKTKKLDHYIDSKYHGIRGIVIEKDRKVGSKFRLIDGYHRCTASTGSKVRVLKAYK